MKLYRSFIAGFAASILACGVALAQQAPPIQQSGSRLDAAIQSQYSAGSINEAQTTLTIPANGNLCAYVDSLTLGVGEDATGATGSEAFTTTNLGNLGWTFLVVAGWTGAQAQQQLIGAAPYKAAVCGVAVTVVSPAQNAHLAYPMQISYHYAP